MDKCPDYREVDDVTRANDEDVMDTGACPFEDGLTSGSYDSGGADHSSISPCPNVMLRDDESSRVLAYGIDTLVLSIDVEWENTEFLETLRQLKASARLERQGIPYRWRIDETDYLELTVEQYGTQGHEWVMNGSEYRFRIGAWRTPIAKPSIVVELHSYVIWRLGPKEAVDRLVRAITSMGGRCVATRVSRVDLCVDILLRESDWSAVTDRSQRVQQAIRVSTNELRGQVTGITLGSGPILARVYDKLAEIRTSSQKWWMLDIWHINGVSPGHRVVRVEYQLRRAKISELGIGTIPLLKQNLGEVWNYLTERWLRYVDDSRKHQTHQNTLPWWRDVQGALGSSPQEGNGNIRARLVRKSTEHLLRQIAGYLSSLAALRLQGDDMAAHIGLRHWAMVACSLLLDDGYTLESFRRDVNRKRAKYSGGVVPPLDGIPEVWSTDQYVDEESRLLAELFGWDDRQKAA